MSSGGALRGLLCDRPGVDDLEEFLSRKKGLARGNLPGIADTNVARKASRKASEPTSGSKATQWQVWWAEVRGSLRNPYAGSHRWLEPLYHDNLASLVDKTSRQFHYGFDATRRYSPAVAAPDAYAAELWRCLHEVLQKARPSTLQNPIDFEFARLAQNWKAETAHLSSITKAAMHPAYQRIIGMGFAALPLLLRELRDGPRQWFWALKAISGEDPVEPADRGNVRKMREAWLEWGRSRGHIR